MPYISTEKVAEIRKELKATFPEYKFSVRKDGNVGIFVTVLAGPIQLMSDPRNDEEFVNEFHYESHYAGEPEKLGFLRKLLGIVRRDVYTIVEDSDYGAIPSFYTNISIGDWRKPYKVTK